MKTTEEKMFIGEQIANAFNLKLNKKTNFYQTGYGQKSAIGIFEMFKTIAEKIQNGEEKTI